MHCSTFNKYANATSHNASLTIGPIYECYRLFLFIIRDITHLPATATPTLAAATLPDASEHHTAAITRPFITLNILRYSSSLLHSAEQHDLNSKPPF